MGLAEKKPVDPAPPGGGSSASERVDQLAPLSEAEREGVKSRVMEALGRLKTNLPGIIAAAERRGVQDADLSTLRDLQSVVDAALLEPDKFVILNPRESEEFRKGGRMDAVAFYDRSTDAIGILTYRSGSSGSARPRAASPSAIGHELVHRIFAQDNPTAHVARSEGLSALAQDAVATFLDESSAYLTIDLFERLQGTPRIPPRDSRVREAITRNLAYGKELSNLATALAEVSLVRQGLAQFEASASGARVVPIPGSDDAAYTSARDALAASLRGAFRGDSATASRVGPEFEVMHELRSHLDSQSGREVPERLHERVVH